MLSIAKSPLTRRLLPLYVAAFSHGFVLWYAIEKYFMHDIGFTDATIGLMVAIYTATTLLIETPSGILADRWSRRGVLLIASLCLIASNLIGGLSYGVTTYIVAMAVWGVFYALYSGTYDSIVYDVLLEERGTANEYEKWYGYVRSFDSVALAAGALLGGVIAMWYSPRVTFFVTVPFSCIALFALLKFKEPQLHKIDPISSLRLHITETFSAVLRRRTLLPLVVVLATTTLLIRTILEFNQLWWLAVAAPIGLYGLATAANLSAPGIGGLLASRIRLDKPLYAGITGVTLLICAAVLTNIRYFWAIIAAQVTLVTILLIAEILFTKSLHDALPSRLRAGSVSAVSTLASIVFIPFSLLFGFLSNKHDTFTAAWLLASLVLALVVVVAIMGVRWLLPARPADTLQVEQYQR